MNDSANRNSFQQYRNVSIAAVATPGAASGNTTSHNALTRDAPSSIAASSNSGDSCRKKPVSSQTARGAENVTYGSTRPGNVSRRLSSRSIRYSGGTIEICGNIETARMSASSSPWPRNRSRARAYAHSAEIGTVTTVVIAATTSELRIGIKKSRSSKSAR